MSAGQEPRGLVCDSGESGVRVNNVSVIHLPERTFASTEAQTEEPHRPHTQQPPPRRLPRHQRRPAPPPLDRRPLPDLLVDSHHLPPPPPYTQPPPPPPPPPPIPLPFHLLPTRRRRGSVYREVPKSCCGLLSPAALSIRWLMLLLLTVGVCCALVGTLLGATRATAPHHLTVALLMIGVGIVLVTVSGVGWRLMSTQEDVGSGGGLGAEDSCRAFFGLAPSGAAATASQDPAAGHENTRRFLPRLPPSYGRPHHPYAAMMYPEFQYRAPPPSYQASMQEYRLRLLLLDRHTTASPPPTYRSHPSTLLRGGLGFGRRELCSPPEYSRPPSYRSRTSTEAQAAAVGIHSRQVSTGSGGAASSHPIQQQRPQESSEDVAAAGLKPGINHTAPPLPLKENTVTIVQSGEEPTGPVIVTISGGEALTSHHHSHHHHPDQMEILAHL